MNQTQHDLVERITADRGGFVNWIERNQGVIVECYAINENGKRYSTAIFLIEPDGTIVLDRDVRPCA